MKNLYNPAGGLIELHLGSHWRIGSDETGRSFTARFWGISWARSLDRPTRGLFYMSSDREKARAASDGDTFIPSKENDSG